MNEELEKLRRERKVLLDALRKIAQNAPENGPQQSEFQRNYAIAYSFWVAGQEAKLTLWSLSESSSRE